MLQFYIHIQINEKILIDLEAFIISKFNSSYIGDDAAFVDGYCYSMDSFCEDTHFKREWMSMSQIGRKAMLVNLSDAVAMNAQPLFALLSLSLPKDVTMVQIDELTGALQKCAKEFGCEIIGGDTISAQKISITIAVISKSDNPLFRKGLREGDVLAYTGKLGNSKKDLDRLFSGESIAKDSVFYEPQLRVDFVSQAREFLSSGMDISDGLFCDTNKLLDINSCGLELYFDIPDDLGLSGEEYEMLIGFKKEHLKDIEQIAISCGVRLTPFGKVKDNGFRFECKNSHF